MFFKNSFHAYKLGILNYGDKSFIRWVKLMKAKALQEYREANDVENINKMIYLASGQIQLCNECLSVATGTQTLKNLHNILGGV